MILENYKLKFKNIKDDLNLQDHFESFFVTSKLLGYSLYAFNNLDITYFIFTKDDGTTLRINFKEDKDGFVKSYTFHIRKGNRTSELETISYGVCEEEKIIHNLKEFMGEL